MDQRPHPRAAVPGAIPEDVCPFVDRGYREIPRLRDDPRHRPGLRQAHGRQFGKDVFDIIEANPERLREVEGIGPMRAAKIASAWADQKVIREIMVFLHEHGVGTARAVRIFKTYSTDAV